MTPAATASPFSFTFGFSEAHQAADFFAALSTAFRTIAAGASSASAAAVAAVTAPTPAAVEAPAAAPFVAAEATTAVPTTRKRRSPAEVAADKALEAAATAPVAPVAPVAEVVAAPLAPTVAPVVSEVAPAPLTTVAPAPLPASAPVTNGPTVSDVISKPDTITIPALRTLVGMCMERAGALAHTATFAKFCPSGEKKLSALPVAAYSDFWDEIAALILAAPPVDPLS